MYNLGVTLPHIHQDGVARLLPENRIQYEKDLQVSFPEKQEFFSDRHDGFAVGWRWNETDGGVEAYAWCHDDEQLPSMMSASPSHPYSLSSYKEQDQPKIGMLSAPRIPDSK